MPAEIIPLIPGPVSTAAGIACLSLACKVPWDLAQGTPLFSSPTSTAAYSLRCWPVTACDCSCFTLWLLLAHISRCGWQAKARCLEEQMGRLAGDF